MGFSRYSIILVFFIFSVRVLDVFIAIDELKSMYIIIIMKVVDERVVFKEDNSGAFVRTM